MYEKTVSAWSAAPWFLVSPPLRPSDEVPRPRVVDHLNDVIAAARVTRLVAPSGYGKTSALRQWADRSPTPVAWLTLTEFDDDPARLHRGVVSALKRAAEHVDDDTVAPLLQLVPDLGHLAASYDGLAAALARTASALTLIVDDAHLGGDALRDTIGRLLGSADAAVLRLVVVGSADVAVPAKLRLDGSVVDLAPAALAFTRDEIDRFASTLGLAPDSTLAERVLDRTGGWPAAVRAVLFDATDRTASGPGRGSQTITDLVAEDVLPHLGSDLARFVLAATTCSRVSADLARALSGRDDSASLLETCIRRGLFIDRFEDDDRVPVYRWHTVLAEACRAILVDREPAEAARLQRVAADALRDDYPLPAIDHALRGDDPELAVDIIATSWSGILFQAGATALERACRAVPRPWSSTPEVLVARACCLDISGDRLGAALLAQRADAAAAEADPARHARVDLVAAPAALLLADERPHLEGAVDQLTELLASTPDLPPRTYAHLLFLAGWGELRLRRSPEQSIRLLESAHQEARAIGDDVVAHRAGTNVAFALAFAGRFRDAEARLDATNAAVAERADWNAYDGGIEATARGYIAFHRGALDDAARHLASAAEGPTSSGGYASMAIVHLALASADLGRPAALDEAEQALRRLPETHQHGIPWPTYTAFGRCRIALARGDADQALDLARSIDEPGATPVICGMLAEVHRQLGTLGEAQACLDAGDALVLPSYATVGALVTRALLRAEDGDDDGAHDLIEQALALAADEEVARPFIADDPILRSVLADHGRHGTRHEGFLAGLLSRSEHREAHRSPGVQLSRREREVLGYLRSSLTTAEIADALFVSANTVKTHQRAIYRKLGVSSRREAVNLTI